MAQILRLANEDQTTIIDLMSGPIRWRGGWETQTPGQGGAFTYEPYGAQWEFGNFQPVTETFELIISGTGGDVIAAIDRLMDFLESVRLFHDGDLAAQSCWLEWNAEGEEPKRSLLYSSAFKVTTRGNISPMLVDCQMLGRLVVTRHPLWEDLWTSGGTSRGAAYSADFNTGIISTLGGKYDYTGITGNTLARIVEAELSALPTAGANLAEFWVGIRRYNNGVADFNPLWECEDGTMVSADTTVVADGGGIGDASPAGAGNHVVQCDFSAATTLTSRMTMTVNQSTASTNYNHYNGRYLVLLRCKLSAAGTCGIQLHSGYTGSILAEEIYVDNTAWLLVPIGNISIPPWVGDVFNGSMFSQEYRLDLYAEQLSGTPTLYFDCLVLIPNEHMVHVDGASIAGGIGSDIVSVQTLKNDQEVVFESTAAAIVDNLESELTDWYLPPGSGTIVIAAQDAAQHDLSETMTVYFYYNPRWLLYRSE